MQIVGANLRFSSALTEKVQIDQYDLSGQKLATLLNKPFSAGSHSIALPVLMNKNALPGLCILKIHKGSETLSTSIIKIDSHAIPASNDGLGYDANGPISLSKTTASADNLLVYRFQFTPLSQSVTIGTTQNLGDIVVTRTAAEAAIERKVDSIMALPAFTIAMKAGQMTMARKSQLTDAQYASLGVGSIFNGGSDLVDVPGDTPQEWATLLDRYQNSMLTSSTLKIPMIYGQDCVHGVGTIKGCTVFPHNIGLGCTHDTALISKIAQITANEAAACGIRLNFAPCVASVRNEKWGRAYEGFGETPEINSLMGAAYVRGLQNTGTYAVAASVKHFVGDGSTTDGINGAGGTTNISEATMRAIHLPQYAACAREGMYTVMPSYSSWTHNGTKWFQSLDSLTMTQMLKRDCGFDGFCVSDWDAIPQACVAGSSNYTNSCVAQSINAGMDMAMIVSAASVTQYISAIVSQAGSAIPLSRINDAVKRILRIKFRMNLFSTPLSNSTLRAQINSPQSQAIARQAVRESLVLLKNQNNALPLKTTDKVVVVGQWANDLGAQCGGWTIDWQGKTGNTTGIVGTTILKGLQDAGGSNVTYDQAGANLSGADKVVCVVGESPYAEGNGDNLNNLDLTNVNNAGSLITTCSNSGKPVIVILISGRPLIIDTELSKCAAFVAAWLPGGQGSGIADVLYGGTYNFTGTLTNTWPASYGQIPINTGTNYADEQHGSGGAPQFAFGFGLKY
jgi:beta-glucosidase